MRVENDDVVFGGQITFKFFPKFNVDTLVNSTTPSVNGRSTFITSGSVVTITNFLYAVDGQVLKLLGDGTTTIKNNSTIVTNTGADKLLLLNKVYRFTYFQSKKLWVEDA